MQIRILNIQKGGYTMECQLSLLWSVILLGNRVDMSGDVAGFLFLVVHFDNFTEKERIDYMLNNMLAQGVDANEVEELREMFGHMELIKKVKHKTKAEVRLYSLAQHIIKKSLDEQKGGFKKELDELRLTSLFDMVCIDTKENDKSIYIWLFSEEENERCIEQNISAIVATLKNKLIINLFPALITSMADEILMERLLKPKAEHFFVSQLLYSIPSPESLSSSHINVIRDEMGSLSSPYFEAMGLSLFEIVDDEFSVATYEKISRLFLEKTNELRTQLSNKMEHHPLLNQLTEDKRHTLRYNVYIGITSIDTLLWFFRKLGIVSETTELYSREQLSNKINLKNSRLFMYMKPVDDIR